MSRFPIAYIEPVFQPPSEAESLILPITNGCSLNKRTFCEMHIARQKAFEGRDEDNVEIKRVAELYGNQVKRGFLADASLGL